MAAGDGPLDTTPGRSVTDPNREGTSIRPPSVLQSHVDAVDTDVVKDDQLNSDREAIFAELLAAFGRRDNDVILAAMSGDVVLELPGTSALAGTYRGIDQVGRFVSQLRWVLDAGRHEVSFEHDGDQMLIRHQVAVHGPHHVAGMILFQRFTFDAPSGKITSIMVEPEDRGLFDYVVHTALSDDRVASP
jgi:ketosteroid isomerase-like protein